MSQGAPLRIGSAFPDPPFEVPSSPPTGLDIDLIGAIAAELGRPPAVHRFEGSDFEGIFAKLGKDFDVVVSGATVTEHRRGLARWCRPYLRSGQSLAVNVAVTPDATSIERLGGLVLGVQEGNTSQPVAQALAAAGKVKAVKVYPYGDIHAALGDLEQGELGAFMKLEPVLRWLTADHPALRVVQTGITTELLAIAVARDDTELAAQIDAAQENLRRGGELARIGRHWLAGSDPDVTEILT